MSRVDPFNILIVIILCVIIIGAVVVFSRDVNSKLESNEKPETHSKYYSAEEVYFPTLPNNKYCTILFSKYSSQHTPVLIRCYEKDSK